MAGCVIWQSSHLFKKFSGSIPAGPIVNFNCDFPHNYCETLNHDLLGGLPVLC